MTAIGAMMITHDTATRRRVGCGISKKDIESDAVVTTKVNVTNAHIIANSNPANMRSQLIDSR
ncbi:hypothetical protein ACFL2H_01900 [Planctomycetota bacterium]